MEQLGASPAHTGLLPSTRSKSPRRSERITSTFLPPSLIARYSSVHPPQTCDPMPVDDDSARSQGYKSVEDGRTPVIARPTTEEETTKQRKEGVEPTQSESAADRGRVKTRPRPTLPNWSVIPRKGAATSLETIAAEGTISAHNIADRKGKGKTMGGDRQEGPFDLLGSFSELATALSSVATSSRDESTKISQPVQLITPITLSLPASSQDIIGLRATGALEEGSSNDRADDDVLCKAGTINKGKSKAVAGSAPVRGPTRTGASPSKAERWSSHLNIQEIGQQLASPQVCPL